MSTAARIGVMLPRNISSAQLLPFAQRAEQLGFDQVWVVEDLAFRGGIAQAAAVLASTTSIRVGVGILPAAARTAAFTAMEAATLAQLYPGRLDLGVGHGMPAWMQALGVWPTTPLTFLSEYVDEVATLLRGAGVPHATDPDAPLTSLDPSAVPEVAPSILLGVRGPRSLAVSGQKADGTILAEPSTPEYIHAALGAIDADGPHRLVAYNIAAVDDDPAIACAAARPGLQWVAEPDAAPHLDPVDISDEVRALRAACASRDEFVSRLPDSWVARLALVGTPAQVRARLDELDAAGATDHVLIPVGGDPLGALPSLARVLPPR
ncbi:MAG: LLM class flavin-dependent oxidoreductase [Microcella sp.]|uniref:LLM class flavin-dependent oxidoreductase n=1 Tax=Microcella sp. TaxID=1913979 RepID=UPI0033148CF2